MSDTPVYWSQPNQQVVRNGDPVGIVEEGPDPQDAPTDDELDGDDDEAKTTHKKAKSSRS